MDLLDRFKNPAAFIASQHGCFKEVNGSLVYQSDGLVLRVDPNDRHTIHVIEAGIGEISLFTLNTLGEVIGRFHKESLYHNIKQAVLAHEPPEEVFISSGEDPAEAIFIGKKGEHHSQYKLHHTGHLERFDLYDRFWGKDKGCPKVADYAWTLARHVTEGNPKSRW